MTYAAGEAITHVSSLSSSLARKAGDYSRSSYPRAHTLLHRLSRWRATLVKQKGEPGVGGKPRARQGGSIT